jgi:hypothetical protein
MYVMGDLTNRLPKFLGISSKRSLTVKTVIQSYKTVGLDVYEKLENRKERAAYLPRKREQGLGENGW